MYYLLPLFIYFPRLIPGIETQPWLVFLFSVFGLLNADAASEKSAFALTSVCWVVIAVVNTAIYGGMSGHLASSQLLLGPLFLWGAIARNEPPPSMSTIKIVAAAMFGIAVFELIVPGAYQTVADLLLDRASVSDGHRGISILTPEPTYAAIAVMYVIILAKWSAGAYGDKSLFVELLLVTCMILTFSTYAVLLAGTMLLVERPKLFLMLAAIFAFVVIGIIAKGVDNDSGVRAIVAIARIVTADFSDFLASLSLIDPSLGSRIVTNVASFESPLVHASGMGLGCDALGRTYEGLRFEFVFDNEVLRNGMVTGCLKPQSYMASAFLALGWFAIPFVIVLGLLTKKIRSQKRIKGCWVLPLMIVLVMLTVQGQVTNPVPWILIFIGIAGSSNRLPASKAYE